jgi:hypothetical protein
METNEQIRQRSMQPITQPIVWALMPPAPKSKTTAVLLAVFLAFWTWVYTYEKDKGIFWINLALSLLTVGFWGVFVSWPWAIICAAVRPSDFYRGFPNYPVLITNPGLVPVAPVAALPVTTEVQRPA